MCQESNNKRQISFPLGQYTWINTFIQDIFSFCLSFWRVLLSSYFATIQKQITRQLQQLAFHSFPVIAGIKTKALCVMTSPIRPDNAHEFCQARRRAVHCIHIPSPRRDSCLGARRRKKEKGPFPGLKHWSQLPLPTTTSLWGTGSTALY